jgi:hypothetical protein
LKRARVSVPMTMKTFEGWSVNVSEGRGRQRPLDNLLGDRKSLNRSIAFTRLETEDRPRLDFVQCTVSHGCSRLPALGILVFKYAESNVCQRRRNPCRSRTMQPSISSTWKGPSRALKFVHHFGSVAIIQLCAMQSLKSLDGVTVRLSFSSLFSV